MRPAKCANTAQQSVLRTLRVLIEHSAADMAPGEIANEITTLPSNATRDLCESAYHRIRGN